MAVQERYAFAVTGSEDGLALASRLAAFTGAQLRWAAVWAGASGRPDIIERFSMRPVPLLSAAEFGVTMVCVPSPTPGEIRDLIAHAGQSSLCVHWSPPMYESEEGPGAPWISFVDPDGFQRDDARVYRIELASDATPLTTEDRPWHRDFVLGPEPASGWGLRVTAIRDHMPRGELLERLAAAASVPVGSVKAVVG